MSTVKKSLCGLLSLVLALSLLTIPVFAATLEDGEYTVNIKGVEMDSDAEHLQNASLVNPAKLVVSGGVITATLESKGRVLTFLNPTTGEYEDHTINGTGSSSDDYTSDYSSAASAQRIYQLTIADLDTALVVKFPAGQSATGSLTYRIVFDQSTLTKVGGSSTTDTTTTSGTTTNGSTDTSGKVSSPKTEDNIMSTLAILLIAFASMTGVTIVVNKKSLRSKRAE